MEPTEIALGSVWEYKGKQYVVVGLPKVKDDEDGNWYAGVRYMPLDNTTRPPEDGYVRFEEDFECKFRPVELSEEK